MGCVTAFSVANSLAEFTVMSQVVQIIHDMRTLWSRATVLAFEIGAIGAIEVLILVSETHKISPSCEI